jgi:hypothetical protein
VGIGHLGAPHSPTGTIAADHSVLLALHAEHIPAPELDRPAGAPVALREQGVRSQCLIPTLDPAVHCFVDAVKVSKYQVQLDMSAR